MSRTILIWIAVLHLLTGVSGKLAEPRSQGGSAPAACLLPVLSVRTEESERETERIQKTADRQEKTGDKQGRRLLRENPEEAETDEADGKKKAAGSGG